MNNKSISILGMLLFLTLNIGIAFSQTAITPVPGYTTVTKQPNGVYDINSTKPLNNGQVILNRFTEFYLENNDTANIYLGNIAGIAKTAINVVDNPLNTPTVINGLLQLIKGYDANSPVGGKLLFVDPSGVIVGNTGVINAGAIILATSSNTIANLKNSSTEINLNDPLQDALLEANGIDINGIYKFNSITGPVNVAGMLDTLNASTSIGVIPGVNIFANRINLSDTSQILTGEHARNNFMTAKNITWNALLNNASPQESLANEGKIDLDGNINTSGGSLLASVNTLDLFANIINVTGTIDATAIAPAGSSVVELTVSNYIPDVANQGTSSRIFVSGEISASDSINVHTPNSVNMNAKLRAGSIFLKGNGMSLHGTYQASQDDLIVTNTGTNPLLMGSSFVSEKGGLFINNENGETILGVAFLAAGLDEDEGNNARPEISTFSAKQDLTINSKKLTSAARITSQEGALSLSSCKDLLLSQPGSLSAKNNIKVKGDKVNVFQPITSYAGDIIMQTNTGDFLLGQNGTLTSEKGRIYMHRGNKEGPLNAEFYGKITAESNDLAPSISGAGTSQMIFANDNTNNTNSDPVIIAGTTFGPYNGRYDSNYTQLVNRDLVANLHIGSFYVNIPGGQPVPPEPAPPNPGPQPAPPAPNPPNPVPPGPAPQPAILVSPRSASPSPASSRGASQPSTNRTNISSDNQVLQNDQVFYDNNVPAIIQTSLNNAVDNTSETPQTWGRVVASEIDRKTTTENQKLEAPTALQKFEARQEEWYHENQQRLLKEALIKNSGLNFVTFFWAQGNNNTTSKQNNGMNDTQVTSTEKDSEQKIITDSEGNVVISGKAYGGQPFLELLSELQSGTDLKIPDNIRIQSLNPRAKLHARGRKPSFSKTSSDEGAVIIEDTGNEAPKTRSESPIKVIKD